jgi:hypothetical protein
MADDEPFFLSFRVRLKCYSPQNEYNWSRMHRNEASGFREFYSGHTSRWPSSTRDRYKMAT